ncbi:diguanylate cyclase domain-containing protein [Rhizobacter sp. LjRoot28]|uniref:diguanylate cyclase domain-containing protein n=1 Tax=Rhizobacter sp. LjRoot28 TaxID=3342309 RepID=UPI003ECEA788
MKRMLAWRPTTFRAQLAFGVAAVHAVLMSLFVADLVNDQKQFLHDRHVQRGMGIAQGIAQQSLSHLLSADLASAQEAVQGFATYPEMRYVAVLDKNGLVLAHTERSVVGRGMVDAESRRMLQGPAKPGVLVDDGHILDVAWPVLWQGEVIGWVRFAAGMEGVSAQLAKVTIEGIGFAALAVLLGVALAMLMAHGTTRRLYGLVKLAEATGRGERGSRAEADERNEVGRLAGAFNHMLDTLSVKEGELLAANQELESRIAQRTAALAESEEAMRAILEQANDAFVSVNEQGLVTNWNRAAEHTFGWSVSEAIGQPLAELIMPPSMRGAHLSWMHRYVQHGGATRMVDRRAELIGWRRDGSTFPVEVAVRVRTRPDGVRFFDAFLRDISERKQLEAKLQALALEDTLTQLPNRRAALQTLPVARARSLRAGKRLAVLYLDLDGFKGVNDRLGHPAGDEVLRTFGDRLKRCVRASDLVARLGGDEFLVVLESVASEEDATRIAEKCIAASSEPYLLSGEVALLSSSVGIRVVEVSEDASPERLLADADEALYHAKRAGKHCWHLWSSAIPVADGDIGNASESGAPIEPMAAPPALQRLFYVSRSRIDPQAQEQQRTLELAKQRNAALGVTGVLIFSGDHFAQVLEGSPEAIETLMKSIRADSRHEVLREWPHQPANDHRWFPDWSMAYAYDERLTTMANRLIGDKRSQAPLDAVAPTLFAAIESYQGPFRRIEGGEAA